jgi:hypothetical protein
MQAAALFLTFNFSNQGEHKRGVKRIIVLMLRIDAQCGVYCVLPKWNNNSAC